MKTWNERLKQTLLCGHEVLACMDHEDLVRDAFYSDNDLSDETITRLDEVMRCDACRLVVAIVTGDLAWLESQPDIAAPGSAEDDLTATEEPGELQYAGNCAVVNELAAAVRPARGLNLDAHAMEDDSKPQVPVLQLIVPEAGHDVDQKCRFVKTFSVVDTQRRETLEPLKSFVEWLKFRLEEPRELGALAEPDQQLTFAPNLYLQIAGPASQVQSFFDEVAAGNLPELKVAIAPRESTSMFSRQRHGYEARLCGAVEFTSQVSEKFGHDYVKSLIETRFPQTHIEVKVSEDVPSP